MKTEFLKLGKIIDFCNNFEALQQCKLILQQFATFAKILEQSMCSSARLLTFAAVFSLDATASYIRNHLQALHLLLIFSVQIEASNSL